MTPPRPLAAPGSRTVYIPGGVLYAADSSRGLSSNQIHKIARDRFGRLWLAGPAGLSCFDGNFVQTYDRRNGLQCQGLRCVGIDNHGTVWAGTDLGLEALDDSGSVQGWMAWSQWPFGLCEHIDASGDTVWIGSAQGIARIERSAGTQGPEVAFHADVGFVRHFARVSDTHLYVASDALGLVEVEDSTWNRVRCPELIQHRITRVVARGERSLYLGTDAGVMMFDRESAQITSTFALPDVPPQVTALAIGGSTCWVAFGRTLAAFALDAGHADIIECFELESRINDLCVDELGNVWIATDTAGLALVSCLHQAVRRIDIGTSHAVFSIKPVSADTYRVGGEGFFTTLTLAADGTATARPAPPGLPATTVWDSHVDASGTWLATHAGLFHAAPGGRFVQRFADVPVLSAPARAILARGDELWVGTLRGLARIHGDWVEEILPADGKPLGYVYAMHIDSEQRLWVATLGRGLWRESHGLEAITVEPLSPRGNTYAVSAGPNGETLVLQDEKVVMLDAAMKCRLVETHHPVSGWAAIWLDALTVAIGSSEGLRLLSPATGAVSMTIRSLLPAPAWEFTNNRTLVRDATGQLLCGLNGGLVRVNVERLQALSSEPVPRLSSIAWSGASPQLELGRYRLRAGRWSVRVRAFTAWFVEHVQVRYRFKLVGFNDDWTALQVEPEVAYNSLPYGQYQIQVQAYSPLTGYGPAVTLCEIEVTRPWWTMGWTHALHAAGSTFDRTVRSSMRNTRLLERNRTLEQEVAERTAVLRAANAALQHARAELEALSQTDPLTHLANRRYFDQQLQHEIQRGQRQRTPVSLILLDLDLFKAVNDRLGHPTGDDYLRALAKVLRAQLREATDVVARYGGEEFAIIMAATSFEHAMSLAERIRVAVEALCLPNPASRNGHVTVSIGVAAMDVLDTASAQNLLGRADLALYEAKRKGRNQVCGTPSERSAADTSG